MRREPSETILTLLNETVDIHFAALKVDDSTSTVLTHVGHSGHVQSMKHGIQILAGILYNKTSFSPTNWNRFLTQIIMSN